MQAKTRIQWPSRRINLCTNIIVKKHHHDTYEISLNLDQCGNWPRSPLLHKKFALMSDCEEEEGNKKWLRHGRLMQAKTRIQWPSRWINLRNNAQDRYLWLWRVTLLSMIWMWCLGPYFTTILCISTTCYSSKKPTFYCTKYFFIKVISSENKLYDEVKPLNHKINAFWIFRTTFCNPCFLQMRLVFSWQDLLKFN